MKSSLIQWIKSKKWILILFAFVFTAIGITGHFYVVHEITRSINGELNFSGKQILNEIPYHNKWDLKEFRQAEINATHYYIYTDQGMLIDIEGFIPHLLPIHATLPVGWNSQEPTTIISELGESWTIRYKPLKDGVVVIGINHPDTVLLANQKLQLAAAQFGDTLSAASKVQSHTIDQDIEYAVLDKDGVIVAAWGAIPLNTDLQTLNRIESFKEISTPDGTFFLKVFPILGDGHKAVGGVLVVQEVTLQLETVRHLDNFNTAVALIAWISVVLSLGISDRRPLPKDFSLEAALTQGESDKAEFKSSLRTPVGAIPPNLTLAQLQSALESEVAEVVVSFMNTNGGFLFIGVSDDGRVLGLQGDYDSSPRIKDRDGFERHLQQVLSSKVGVDQYAASISQTFLIEDNHDVCRVRVLPSRNPVYLEKGNKFYVRVGNATKPLTVAEAISYSKKHWTN